MRSWLAVPLALALVPGAVSADVYVKAQGHHVTVVAQREPLSRVLAGIVRETGIAVVNPTSAPSQLVSITLENVTPQEALIRLFDGQGMNYIFQLDPTGTRVATLILAGTSSTVARSSASSRPAPVPPPQMYEEEAPPEDEPMPDEEMVEQPVEEEANAVPAAPDGGLSNSIWNPPPGAVVMPQQPGGAGFPGAAPSPYPEQQPNQPLFPGGASNPNPGVPPPSVPRFPGGASQPPF